MRAIIALVAMGLLVSGESSAVAQAILDGPLASPSTAPAKASPAHKAAKTKPKKTHQAAKPATPDKAAMDDQPGRETPVAHKAAAAPEDPLSLGMKWNGSNDNGSQTRVQNYNGTAAGTGAEVGLKLHF